MDIRRALVSLAAFMTARGPSGPLVGPNAGHSVAPIPARTGPSRGLPRSASSRPVPGGRAERPTWGGSWVAWAAVVVIAGCGKDLSTPTDVTSTAAATDTEAVADTARITTSVKISGLPAIGVIGQEFLLQARLFPGDVPPGTPVTWVSSDATVATLREDGSSSSSGWISMTIVGQGEATITVSTQGLADSRRLRAIPADPPLSDELAVDSFSVVELSYSDTAAADMHWHYAPLVVVSDRTGAGVHVYAVRIDIPGIARPYCRSIRDVGAGQSRELFREVYGDYELTFDRPGSRATPGDATVTVYFFDGSGNAGKAVATGPVEAGPPFRDTYTGGAITDPWSC